jgi:hypothetical protein
MPTPEGQDVLPPLMRPPTTSGTGKAGTPFGRQRKKAKRTARKTAAKKAGKRTPAARRRSRKKR